MKLYVPLRLMNLRYNLLYEFSQRRQEALRSLLLEKGVISRVPKSRDGTREGIKKKDISYNSYKIVAVWKNTDSEKYRRLAGCLLAQKGKWKKGYMKEQRI